MKLFQTLIMTAVEQEGGLHSVQKHIYTGDRYIYGYPRAPKTSSKTSNRKETFKNLNSLLSKEMSKNREIRKTIDRARRCSDNDSEKS